MKVFLAKASPSIKNYADKNVYLAVKLQGEESDSLSEQTDLKIEA